MIKPMLDKFEQEMKSCFGGFMPAVEPNLPPINPTTTENLTPVFFIYGSISMSMLIFFCIVQSAIN